MVCWEAGIQLRVWPVCALLSVLEAGWCRRRERNIGFADLASSAVRAFNTPPAAR